MIELSQCSACPLSCNTTAPPVEPQRGLNARLMVVGDHPTRETKLMDRPFSDFSEVLVMKALEEAGFGREDVHLTYALKCVPTHKTPVKTAHYKTCAKWLNRELVETPPAAILALGVKAGTVVLGRPVELEYMVGRLLDGPLCKVAIWFTPSKFGQSGHKFMKESIAFFKTLKEFIDAKPDRKMVWEPN